MIEIKGSTFFLTTDNLSYVFKVDEYKNLIHLYYGSKVPSETHIADLSDSYLKIFASDFGGEEFLSNLLFEYSSCGVGDFRTASSEFTMENGNKSCKWVYESYEISGGMPEYKKMPLPTGNASTLKVLLKDYFSKTYIELYYSVYEKENVILRSVKLINDNDYTVKINKLQSFSLDIREGDLDLVYLYGVSAKERNMARRGVGTHKNVIYSNQGITGHFHSSFYALCDKETNDTKGRVWGVQLMYSGNFCAEIETDSYADTRFNIGISNEYLDYPVASGESFETPVAVLTFSENGFNGMAENFQNFTARYVVPEKFRKTLRPIVVNTWDACVFDVNEEKCFKILEKAKEIGADLFVIDDGWFGRRNDEFDGLGDWYENKEKFPHGLEVVAEKARELGLNFGLWIEPEMVNPLSDAYKENEDYVLKCNNEHVVLMRKQCVLDFSREEVVDFVYKKFSSIIKRLGVSYIKMDMNRYISELNSNRTYWGRLNYDYCVGLYSFLRRLTEEFPDLLIENCAGGGGRYDLGVTRFCAQTWISDNTNPYERCKIIYNSSLLMPVSTMGCHVVSVDASEASLNREMDFIYEVNKVGAVGFENDMLKITDFETEIVKKQISNYRKNAEGLFFSNYYRLLSDENKICYLRVNENKTIAEFTYLQISDDRMKEYLNVNLFGIDENKRYSLNGEGSYSGRMLIKVGIPIKLFDKRGYYKRIYMCEV